MSARETYKRDRHRSYAGRRVDRDRDGLLVFFVGVILLRVAAAVYFLAHLLVAAAPVVMLASGITISCMAPNASRRVVGQWGGAGGAVCEDHFAFVGLVAVAGASEPVLVSLAGPLLNNGPERRAAASLPELSAARDMEAETPAPAPAGSPEARADAADAHWQRIAALVCIKNVCMIPARFHTRSKCSLSVLQDELHLRNFFLELFTKKLVYAQKKWGAVSKDLDRKADAIRQRARDAVVSAGGDLAKAAPTIEKAEDELRAIGLTQVENEEAVDAGCLLEDDEVDQPAVAGLDPKEAAADLMGAIAADKAESAAAERFAQKSDVEALTVAELRDELALRDLDTEGLKAVLVERLWSFDDKEWRDEGSDHTTKVKLSVHRGNQLLYFLALLWDGAAERWPAGGTLRTRVVEMIMAQDGPVHRYWKDACRKKKLKLPWNEEQAILAACAKSSFFHGLWKLLEWEIRVAVVPFERWVDGDIQMFCCRLPFMLLQVIAAGLPTISRFFLLQLDRCVYWAERRPDVLLTWALNARRLDDAHVETINALQGHLRAQRHRPTMEDYVRGSCLIDALHRLAKMLDDAVLSGRRRGTARASQKSENHHLRDIYATESWAESRTDISDWIFGLFEKAARGDAAMDASWPRVDRIEEAEAKLPRLRRLLESWLEKQRRTPSYTGNATEE